MTDISLRQNRLVAPSGGRAMTAAKILLQDGFKQVSILAGGMTEWNRKGYTAEQKGKAT